MGTHYWLKGDLEKAREYLQSAKMLRRQMNDMNKNKLPQIYANKTMPDGTVIKAQEVFGHNQAVIEVPVGVEPVEPPKETRVGQKIGGLYQRLVPAVDMKNAASGGDLVGYVMSKAGNREFSGGYIPYAPYVENQAENRLWSLSSDEVDTELLIRRGESANMGAAGNGMMNNALILYRELEPIGKHTTEMITSSTVTGQSIRITVDGWHHYVINQIHTITKYISFWDNDSEESVGPTIVGPYTYAYNYVEESWYYAGNYFFNYGWYYYDYLYGTYLTHTFEGFGTADFKRWGLLYGLTPQADKFRYQFWDYAGGYHITINPQQSWYIQVDDSEPYKLDTAGFATSGARQWFTPALYKYKEKGEEKTIMTWYWNPWYNSEEYPLQARYKNTWLGVTQWDKNNYTLFPSGSDSYYANIEGRQGKIEIDGELVWIHRSTRLFEETTIEIGSLHSGPLGGGNVDLPFPGRLGG